MVAAVLLLLLLSACTATPPGHVTRRQTLGHPPRCDVAQMHCRYRVGIYVAARRGGTLDPRAFALAFASCYGQSPRSLAAQYGGPATAAGAARHFARMTAGSADRDAARRGCLAGIHMIK